MTPESVLVLKKAGPKGPFGMPEWGCDEATAGKVVEEVIDSLRPAEPAFGRRQGGIV